MLLGCTPFESESCHGNIAGNQLYHLAAIMAAVTMTAVHTGSQSTRHCVFRSPCPAHSTLPCQGPDLGPYELC